MQSTRNILDFLNNQNEDDIPNIDINFLEKDKLNIIVSALNASKVEKIKAKCIARDLLCGQFAKIDSFNLGNEQEALRYSFVFSLADKNSIAQVLIYIYKQYGITLLQQMFISNDVDNQLSQKLIDLVSYVEEQIKNKASVNIAAYDVIAVKQVMGWRNDLLFKEEIKQFEKKDQQRLITENNNIKKNNFVKWGIFSGVFGIAAVVTGGVIAATNRNKKNSN